MVRIMRFIFVICLLFFSWTGVYASSTCDCSPFIEKYDGCCRSEYSGGVKSYYMGSNNYLRDYVQSLNRSNEIDKRRPKHLQNLQKVLSSNPDIRELRTSLIEFKMDQDLSIKIAGREIEKEKSIGVLTKLYKDLMTSTGPTSLDEVNFKNKKEFFVHQSTRDVLAKVIYLEYLYQQMLDKYEKLVYSVEANKTSEILKIEAKEQTLNAQLLINIQMLGFWYEILLLQKQIMAVRLEALATLNVGLIDALNVKIEKKLE